MGPITISCSTAVSAMSEICYSISDDFMRPETSVLNTKEILEHINDEISRLQQVKALLLGSSNGHSRSAGSVSGSAAPKVKGKRVLSVEARKKIAAAQRKRWAKARKAAV
jgi:hypothetical protein